MTTLKIYKTYSFTNKDPAIDQLRTVRQDAKMSYADISAKSGVAVSTLYGWWEGKTRRPQSASLEAVGRAMGYQRKWVKVTGRRDK